MKFGLKGATIENLSMEVSSKLWVLLCTLLNVVLSFRLAHWKTTTCLSVTMSPEDQWSSQSIMTSFIPTLRWEITKILCSWKLSGNEFAWAQKIIRTRNSAWKRKPSKATLCFSGVAQLCPLSLSPDCAGHARVFGTCWCQWTCIHASCWFRTSVAENQSQNVLPNRSRLKHLSCHYQCQPNMVQFPRSFCFPPSLLGLGLPSGQQSLISGKNAGHIYVRLHKTLGHCYATGFLCGIKWITLSQEQEEYIMVSRSAPEPSNLSITCMWRQ